MASIQEPSNVEIRARAPNGRIVTLFGPATVSKTAPGGGAPDGALASVVTPERQIFVPINSAQLRDNDVVEVVITTVAGDGIDVSDCVWQIPITLSDGRVQILAQSDFTRPTPADYTAVANIPVVVGGFVVNQACRFGGSQLYLDVQDDTA